jgi:hypothetical protein
VPLSSKVSTYFDKYAHIGGKSAIISAQIAFNAKEYRINSKKNLALHRFRIKRKFFAAMQKAAVLTTIPWVSHCDYTTDTCLLCYTAYTVGALPPLDTTGSEKI